MRIFSTPARSEEDRTRMPSAQSASEVDTTQVIRVPDGDTMWLVSAPAVLPGDLTQVLPIPRQRRPVEGGASLLDTHTTLLPIHAFNEGARLAVARVPESIDSTPRC